MITKYLKLSIFLIGIITCLNTINAQEGDALINSIRTRLAAIDTLLTAPARSSEAKAARGLETTQNETEELDEIDKWVKSFKKIHASRTGLDAGTSYEYKHGNHQSVDDYDEYDEFVTYSHRVQASITWNIMNSALIGKKNYNEKADLLGEQKKLKAQKEITAQHIKEATMHQIEIINAYYNNMIKSKELLYDAMIELQEYLIKREKSTPFNMLELKYKRTLLQSNLRSTGKQFNGIFDTEGYLKNQHEFNSEEIDSLTDLSHGLKEWQVTKRLLENEEKSYNYANDIKISPFARVNYYKRNMMDAPDQITGHVGMSLSFPINGSAKAKRDEVKQRSKLHNFRLTQIKEEAMAKITPLCKELNENLAALNTALKAEEFYLINIKESYKAYKLKRLTIMELCQAYEKLLDCQLSICDLAGKREQLAAQLLYSSINN